MKTPLRILMLEPNFMSTYPAGGQMLLLARALSKRHQITVVASRVDPSLQDSVEWIRTEKPVYYGSSRVFAKALSAHRGEFFDIVHTSDPKIHPPKFLNYRGNIATVHSCVRARLEIFRSGGMRYNGQNWKFRLIYNVGQFFRFEVAAWKEKRLAQAPNQQVWVAVSKGLADELRRFYRPEGYIEVIPNAIEHEKYINLESLREPIRVKLGLQKSDVVAIAVAHGHWAAKGFFDLLLALTKTRTPLKLIVVGHARLNILRKEVKVLGLHNRVRFVGFTSDPRPYYAAADFFVLPSYYEAFPLAHLEAAASGLPVISTRVNGVSEWLLHGRSGFFIRHDPDDIARKMDLLAEDPDLRLNMGEEAQRAVSHYTVQAMVSAYESLYERILEGSRLR